MKLKYILTYIDNNKWLFYELLKRDLQQKYVGSYLGILWVLLQPFLFVSVLYLVFRIGFRAGKTNEMPFSVYLLCGMTVWLFFSESISLNTRVIQSYSFLVKKIDFRLGILPVVKIIVSLIPHVFLILISIIVAWTEGYMPSLYLLQLIFYSIGLCVLLLGICWLTSSVSLFIKDVSSVVSVILQFGLWVSPVFWNVTDLPSEYQWIAKLNPLHYVMTGYRDSIVLRIGFWERMNEALYFWSFALTMFFAGFYVFKRLRPHMAEVV